MSMPDETRPSVLARCLRIIGTFLVLGIASNLSGESGSREPPPIEFDEEAYRRDLHTYLWGIGLALLLSSIPFALVHWHALSHFWLMIAIGAFALVQIVAHFRFFLHIDLSTQKREDLELILFSGLIIAVMAGGTIWILFNQQMRMH